MFLLRKVKGIKSLDVNFTAEYPEINELSIHFRFDELLALLIKPTLFKSKL